IKPRGFLICVAHALLRAASPLLGTLLVDRRASTRVSMRHAGVRAPRRLVAQSDSLAVPEYRLTSGGLRLDPAGKSACATKTGSQQIPRHQEFGVIKRFITLVLVLSRYALNTSNSQNDNKMVF